MEFGRVRNLSKVDFTFPETPNFTRQHLASLPNTKGDKPKVWVGCPIWRNKDWRGKVYPVKAKENQFLQFYAKQFQCIELNTTHYRIPDAATIQRWRTQTPANFLFCPKIPQEISHTRQLLHAEALTSEFTYQILGLASRLGLTFLQLPPNFSTQKSRQLVDYLETFPKNVPLGVEFRHASWFEGSTEKVLETMRKLGISTVITDVAGRRDVLHQWLTTDTVAIRFIGNGLHPTDFERLEDWLKTLKNWTTEGLKNIYFWVHQPDNTLAPEMVRHTIKRFNETFDLSLPEPLLVSANPPAEQTSLF